MIITIKELEKLVEKSLKNFGYPKKEIDIIKQILLYAQLRGNNQGVVKLIGKGIPRNPDAEKIKIIKETKLSALIDGGKNFGMIVMKKALDLTIKKAKKHGFGIVGTNNTASSTGSIGYYVREIAKLGLIGFAFAGSPPTVAPYGSFEALYGTNPLAIGMPTTGEPVILDMATAAMAYYGLIEAKTAGKQIPPDRAYDKDGNPTTDPSQAMNGAIKPFGAYKGSGLGFMVTALTGPLVDAACAGFGKRNDWGNLLFAIDPELLIDRKEFLSNIQKLVSKVKQTKKCSGIDEIYVAGERGNKLAEKRITVGKIDIEENLYKGLQKSAGV